MEALDQTIMQVLEGYKAAVFAKDVDAFVALYDTDVQVFDMWGEWSYDGIAAWRAMATEWFGSLGDERVVVTFDQIRTTVAGQMALASAFITYTGTSAEGQPLRSLQNRMTMALARSGGGWKIVHEHSSAPADFATLKVMLQR